jgi:hypothetical protein
LIDATTATSVDPFTPPAKPPKGPLPMYPII